MPRKGKSWTPEADDTLRTALVAGTSLPDLSSLLGRSESSIRSRAYILRLSLDPKGTRLTPSERLQEMRLTLSTRATGPRAKR
jgi:hypothetical protein